jgi:hypothetical protein
MFNRIVVIAFMALTAITTTAYGGTASEGSGTGPLATNPQCRWSIDFVADPLIKGHGNRVRIMVDDCTRQCLGVFAEAGLAQPLHTSAKERNLSQAN